MSMKTEYNFTLVKKGYDPDEVAAYIESLQSKCRSLQSRNAELEQKLGTSRRLIRRFTDMENGLRQNIADSKRAAATMLSDTKQRSEKLLDSARESCGEIISDLDMKIAGRMNTVDAMKSAVTTFKDQLFELYSSHIQLIETIAEGAENFSYEPDYTPIADAVEEFEAQGEPEVQMPEFEEYPDESIFEEAAEEEAPAEDNVWSAEDPADDAAEFEVAAEDDYEEYGEAEEIEELEEDEDPDVATEEPLNIQESEDVSASPPDDDDYVRFLNDFVNGDDD